MYIPLKSVNKKEPCNRIVFYLAYSFPILPNNISMFPILLCICNTRFPVLCSRKSRRPEHVTGCLCASLRNRNYVSLNLGERSLEQQLCRLQFVERLMSPAMYRLSKLWSKRKVLRSPSKASIWVRNHMQSVDIKIRRASCSMQSLANKSLDKSLDIHWLFSVYMLLI